MFQHSLIRLSVQLVLNIEMELQFLTFKILLLILIIIDIFIFNFWAQILRRNTLNNCDISHFSSITLFKLKIGVLQILFYSETLKITTNIREIRLQIPTSIINTKF